MLLCYPLPALVSNTVVSTIEEDESISTPDMDILKAKEMNKEVRIAFDELKSMSILQHHQ